MLAKAKAQCEEETAAVKKTAAEEVKYMEEHVTRFKKDSADDLETARRIIRTQIEQDFSKVKMLVPLRVPSRDYPRHDML